MLVVNSQAGTSMLTNQFLSLLLNFKPVKAQVRHDTLEGRDCLVVPCVMMTEGVHQGSKGPLLYPVEELSKTPIAWNAKPVVVYHPQLNGAAHTACDPVIFDRQKIGLLMNTRWDGGRLLTECWLDEEKTKLVDDRVLAAIENGSMMEVSTGLFADEEQEEGDWHGKPYKAIARNYRPDHLAILPDLVGACSIADGAGLLRNAAAGDGASPVARLARHLVQVFNELSHSDIWNQLNKLIRGSNANADAWVVEVWDGFFIFEQAAKTYHQLYEVKDGVVQLSGERQEAEKATRYRLANGTMVGNAVTKTEDGESYPASAYAYAPDLEKPSTWKLRLWESPDKKETAAQVGRAVAAIGKGFRGQKVRLPADAVSGVKAKIRAAWRRTNPDKEETDVPKVLMNQMRENKVMDRKQKVESLISNAKTPWAEEDRESLMGLSEEQLDWMLAHQSDPAKKEPDNAADEQAKDQTPAADEQAKPTGNQELSVDQYIANAPEGMRDVLRAGVASYAREKQALVAKITANKRNPFTAEQLMTRGLEELKGLAQLAEEPVARPPHFAGQAEPATVNNQGGEEPLEAPKLNFETKDKE